MEHLPFRPLPPAKCPNDNADGSVNLVGQLLGYPSSGRIVGEEKGFRRFLHESQRFQLACVEQYSLRQLNQLGLGFGRGDAQET